MATSHPPQPTAPPPSNPPQPSQRAQKYRGATVEDLDLPPALSTSPSSPISTALLRAFEHDYTHLTVISDTSRALLGYLSIPRLKQMLDKGEVREDELVEKAMLRFRRRGRVYRVITMETTLEELEGFFDEEASGGVGEGKGEGNGFAVVTDGGRRWVLGVATRGDMEEFVRRRPA